MIKTPPRSSAVEKFLGDMPPFKFTILPAPPQSRPFVLHHAKQGAPLITQDGRRAQLLSCKYAEKRGGDPEYIAYPVHARVFNRDGSISDFHYNGMGEWISACPTEHDLFIDLCPSRHESPFALDPDYHDSVS